MVEEFSFDNTEERRKHRQNGTGWVEVIVGSMFSGKSEELIRRLNRAAIARQKVQVFKPTIDSRYSVEEIASHSGRKHLSKPVASSAELVGHMVSEAFRQLTVPCGDHHVHGFLLMCGCGYEGDAASRARGREGRDCCLATAESVRPTWSSSPHPPAEGFAARLPLLPFSRRSPCTTEAARQDL